MKIFPPQLNGYNTFSTAENSNELYLEGRWNSDLAELWANEATHIILTQFVYKSADLVVEKYVKTGLFSEVIETYFGSNAVCFRKLYNQESRI